MGEGGFVVAGVADPGILRSLLRGTSGRLGDLAVGGQAVLTFLGCDLDGSEP